MEDLIKALNISQIYFLDMVYKDKNNITRTIHIDVYEDGVLKLENEEK